MKRPQDDKSSLWTLDQKEINFLIKKVEAGSYAATYTYSNTFNGYSSGVAWYCLKDGAFVYKIEPGMINIISSRNAFPKGAVARLGDDIKDDEILMQFSRSRINYPRLRGDPIVLKPASQVRWKNDKSDSIPTKCVQAEPESIALSRISVRQKNIELDEDEKAAITAALKNIKKTDIDE